jgi:MFS family permease
VSYVDLIRSHPDFRRLWIATVVSSLGDWFNTIAMYTAVQALSGTGQAVALVMVVKTLPGFLVIPVAGPLIDRYDRRRLLLAMDLARALCTLGLIAAHQAGWLAGLYLFAFLMMAFSGIALPTRSAVLPMILPHANLAVANALDGGTWSIMLAVGAALGGAATHAVGIDASFAVDGATFLLSAAALWRLPALRPKAGSRDQTSLTEGLRYLSRNPYIVALVSLKPLLTLAGGILVLIPLYGTTVFPGISGPVFVGLLWAARGGGAVVGTLCVRLWFGDAPRTLRRLVLLGYVLLAGACAWLSTAESYEVACAAYFAAAVGSGVVWVFSGTLLQWEGDPAYHGRLFSVEFGLTTLILAGTSYASGAAVDAGFAPSDVALASAAVTALPALLWLGTLIGARRRLRRRALERLQYFYEEAAAAESFELSRLRAERTPK